MKAYDHTVVAKGSGRFQKLLEHLRYSGAIIVSWRDVDEVLIAECRLKGTRQWMDTTIKRVKSFTQIEIKDVTVR